MVVVVVQFVFLEGYEMRHSLYTLVHYLKGVSYSRDLNFVSMTLNSGCTDVKYSLGAGFCLTIRII